MLLDCAGAKGHLTALGITKRPSQWQDRPRRHRHALNACPNRIVAGSGRAHFPARSSGMNASFLPVLALGAWLGCGCDGDRGKTSLSGGDSWVPASEVLDDPTRYAGQTIKLEGIWRSGFENSSLLTNRNQFMSHVWVDADWAAISAQDGEVTNWFGRTRKDESLRSGPDRGVSIRFKGLCFVETRFKSRPTGTTQLPPNGYGHLSGWPSRLTIHRLVEYAVASE
jgi:hypothetical protein